MKPHRHTTTARRCATLILAGSILALLGSGAAHAASRTWTGGGNSGNPGWQTTSNWGNQLSPGSTTSTTNLDTATFQTDVAYPVVIDLNRNIGFIDFDGSASAVTIGAATGNALRLSDGGVIEVLSTNTTGGGFTIAAPLSLYGNAQFFAYAGTSNPGLAIMNTVSGALAGVPQTLILGGSSTNTATGVYGAISNGASSALTLYKGGAGYWRLDGDNTYTGGMTMNGGTLDVYTPTALGTGTVTFTGSSTLSVLPQNGGTIANNVLINSGVTANLQGYGAASGTTLTGVISGSGNATAASGQVFFGNANTYTGVTSISGAGLTIGTIGDIGTATPNSLGKASGVNATIQFVTPGNLYYTGSTLGSSNRVVNVAGTGGGLSASGTATFALSGGVTSTATSGASDITFAGSTFGSESGVISNGTGTNVVTVTKAELGTWTLSGANTYAGVTTIRQGTLQITTIGNAGTATPNALGMPSGANAIIQVGTNSTGAGTLRYIGSTLGSSDRIFSLVKTTGGTFNLEASGSIPFTLSGGITSAGTSGTSLLTLGGTSVGSESGVIANGTGTNVTALTKAGAGTWTLSAAETYTGATTVGGGELFVNGSIAGSAATVSGTGSALGGMGTVGSVSVGSGAILEGGAGSPTGALTSGGNVSLLDGSSIELTLGGSLTHSTLARTGGTWVFDSNQAFTFNIGGGATAGFYDNIITGLTGSEAGLSSINTWTIDPALGMTGTFTNDGAGHVDLNVTTVPEPSSAVALVGGLLLLGLRRRRARA